MADERRPFGKVLAYHIVDVAIRCRVFRNEGQTDLLRQAFTGKFGMIAAPQLISFRLDLVQVLQLGIKKRRRHLGRKKGRAHIDPGIFIHFAAEKSAPVRALFPDDLRAAHEGRVIDDQDAAFAGADILDVVEAEGSQVAYGTQGSFSIKGIDGLGGIFNDDNPLCLGDGHELIHFAGDAAVMDYHDCLCPRGDQPGDGIHRDIRLAFVAVREDNLGTAEDKWVYGRNESIGGDDDFIARPDAGKDGRHLERIGTGAGEEYLRELVSFLEEFLAFFGESAIAREFPVVENFIDIPELFARDKGEIKGYHIIRLLLVWIWIFISLTRSSASAY